MCSGARRAHVRGARSDVSARGVDAILEISHRFTQAVMTSPPFRLFLERSLDGASRTADAGRGVHERTVALQREIFGEAFAGR